MNSFFRKLPLSLKLIIVGIIPVLFLLYLSGQLYYEKKQKVKIISGYIEHIHEAGRTAKLISELETERKFSYEYALKKDGYGQMILQRTHTDSAIRVLKKNIDPNITEFQQYTFINSIPTVRNALDTSDAYPASEIMKFYTEVIFRLNTLNQTTGSSSIFLKPVYQDMIAQKTLFEMVTYLGIISTNIYNVLYTRQNEAETIKTTQEFYNMFKSYEIEFLLKASPSSIELFNEQVKTTDLNPTLRYVDQLFKSSSFDSSYYAERWWNVSSIGKDVLKKQQWDPVIFYCHHQTAPFPTRIFIPPFTEPISSNIHPLMARWLNVLGIDMAAWLDEHGMPGAVHRVGFDNWYPGFLDFTHIFRNSISFFTETALYAYATPHFYTVNDFPKDRQGLRSEIFYSSPWKGGWWRLGDAVRYMLGASMSVLGTAAKHRETLLYNRYQAARDNMERFRQEPPYAYVIPQEQRDPPTAAILIDKLLTNGIDVQQAAQPFAANGRQYPNAWVVLMDQPFSPLVKELFEAQQWPDLRATPNGAPTRPYDVAGWTLPMQMGVEVAAVLQPVTAGQRAVLRPIDAATPPPGAVQGTGTVFTLSRNSNASFKALNETLAGGGQASFSKGDIVLSGLDATRAAALARQHALAMRAVAKAPADAVATKKPRLGLYRPWTPSMD